jgi:secretion/DNA translocation related CpaE-like protein
MVGVVGGNGGAGASTFAAVLAGTAPAGVLVDLDGVGGGIDVLLGIEHVPGARWSQLRLEGGHLDPGLLESGLPRWGSVPVLAADCGLPEPGAVEQVLKAAAVLGSVIVDLPRLPCPAREAALARCDLIVVVCAATVHGVAAGRAVVDTLTGAPVGLVVWRGLIRPREVGGLLGAPVLGVVPGRPAPPDRALDPNRLPPRLARVAAGVLDGLAVAR